LKTLQRHGTLEIPVMMLARVAMPKLMMHLHPMKLQMSVLLTRLNQLMAATKPMLETLQAKKHLKRRA